MARVSTRALTRQESAWGDTEASNADQAQQGPGHKASPRAVHDAADDGRGCGRHIIVFHPVTRGHVSRKFFDFDRWPRDNGTPDDVLDDMVERKPEGKQFTLADYQPSNPNIAVATLNRSELEYWTVPRFPQSCGYVVPYLPGYSRDGKTALFFFRLPPLGEHPGWGYYQLKKKNGRWDIAKKHLYHLL